MRCTKLGGHSYDKLFSGALARQDQTVRSNAALILGKIGEKRQYLSLRPYLRDSQSSDKAMFVAVEAMARLGDESMYSKLWAMLLSTYADDRVIGIRAMGALGTQPARNALITCWMTIWSKFALRRQSSLGRWAIRRRTGGTGLFYWQVGVSDAERTNRAKALAALAIGRIKTPALIKYLPDLLNSDSKGVRLAAAKAALLDRMIIAVEAEKLLDL